MDPDMVRQQFDEETNYRRMMNGSAHVAAEPAPVLILSAAAQGAEDAPAAMAPQAADGQARQAAAMSALDAAMRRAFWGACAGGLTALGVAQAFASPPIEAAALAGVTAALTGTAFLIAPGPRSEPES